MRRLVVAVTIAAAVLAPAAAGAVEQQDGDLRIESVDPTGHPQVTTTVVAPRTLADESLDAGHFTVLENGRRREVVAERVTAAAQEVVLVLDVSGSMSGQPLADAKAAARRFLDATPDNARVAVVSFAAEPVVAQPFTTDDDAAAAAVDALAAGGRTALYDGLVRAAALFSPDRGAPGAVVLLSDGADSNSTSTLRAAAGAIATAGAGFYAVELISEGSDPVALSKLADSAHGVVASATDSAALADVYETFATDVNNRYRLRFVSGAHDGAEVTVAVDAAGVRQSASAGVLLPAAPPWRRALASGPGLVLGAVLSFVALAGLVLSIIGRPARQTRLRRAGRSDSSITGLAGRASAMAESTLARRGWAASLEAALDVAGLAVRPGEFLVIAGGAVMGAAAIGMVVGGAAGALLLAGIAVVGTRMFVSMKTSRRRSNFADQLDDTLQLLAGSLRAGHSLLQALDAVSREAEAPARDEFRRVVRETRIGRDLSAAMDDAAARMASEDFRWIVQAVAIHREVGGDLASILDTAADTIRERGQVRRQAKALSAEGRLSGLVLIVLPLGLAGFMTLTNPAYIGVLTRHPIGWGMLGMAGVLMTVGALWLRKLVRISL